MDHEECYIFTPNVGKSEPARKRRKKRHSDTLEIQQHPFSPLMRGRESDKDVQSRYETFQDLWLPQEKALRGLIDDANAKATEDVKSFVLSAFEADHGSNIPAGLMVQGPENSTSTDVYDVLCKDLAKFEDTMCIKLTAGQSPNLRTILRYINQAVTSPADALGSTNDEATVNLNYDLQTLHLYSQRESLRQVVLFFEDSEAFEGALLSDLIDLLKLWNDRIPFVFLFGIATSMENFHEKLSRNAMLCLYGKKFEIKPVDIESMFNIVHSASSRLFIGAGLSKLIIERQRSFISNAQSFVRLVKYVYMAHVFSNPLSVWLDPLAASRPCGKESVRLIRHLPSFRRALQQIVDAGQYETARKLLDNDTELCQFTRAGVHSSLETLREMKSAVDVIFAISKGSHSHGGHTDPTWSELYILAISNRLLDSDLLKDTLDQFKKLKPRVLKECLESMMLETSNGNDPDLCILTFLTDLNDLLAKVAENSVLRTVHDIQLSNLRTTVVAQKVELGRSSATVTKEEASYAKIVDTILSKMEAFLGSRLCNPQDTFLHEILLYDFKRLHHEVFMPRPRFAIERALRSSQEYLGCMCCNDALGGLSASQPATAIVYRLYLESGSVINIADLWTAFWTVVESEENPDEDVEREKALALFSRALAELKYLGLIKNSRKKVEHLAKLVWSGL